MADFVKNPENYEKVRAAVEPELNELPILKSDIKFGDAWYQSNIYPSGKMTKTARKSLESRQDYIIKMMVVLHGIVPRSFGYDHFDWVHTIEFFRWCVKKLRVTAGISDPVTRRETVSNLWEYNLQPLMLQNDAVVVPDDQIIPRPPEYRGSTQPTNR